ncbi:hypothetical protein T492DRAFT_397574 [Pavlovales sp. CCMP2436]|nr:hypothetical protein T492DRAFT_397574 [Pavlovales sp. CCMP2436]
MGTRRCGRARSARTTPVSREGLAAGSSAATEQLEPFAVATQQLKPAAELKPAAAQARICGYGSCPTHGPILARGGAYDQPLDVIHELATDTSSPTSARMEMHIPRCSTRMTLTRAPHGSEPILRRAVLPSMAVSSPKESARGWTPTCGQVPARCSSSHFAATICILLRKMPSLRTVQHGIDVLAREVLGWQGSSARQPSR